MRPEDVVAHVFPDRTFRGDTPIAALMRDRVEWLACAHALTEAGYAVTDDDVASWTTVADMLETLEGRGVQ